MIDVFRTIEEFYTRLGWHGTHYTMLYVGRFAVAVPFLNTSLSTLAFYVSFVRTFLHSYHGNVVQHTALHSCYGNVM